MTADSNKEVIQGEVKFAPRFRHAISSYFNQGRYPPLIMAAIEPVANAIFHSAVGGDQPTRIIVTINKDYFDVTDYGGAGGDSQTELDFFNFGVSDEKGTAHFGAGAKAAAIKWGRDLELRAKKPGQTVEYVTKIKGFGDEHEDLLRPFTIEEIPSQWDPNKGRFQFTVRKPHDPDNTPSLEAVAKALGETFRPRIIKPDKSGRIPAVRREEDARLAINEKGNLGLVNDKVALSVSNGGKNIPVEPLDIPLAAPYTETLQTTKTDPPYSETVPYWMGELDFLRARGIKSGARVYMGGQLLGIHDLGLDLRDPRLNSLVGEVHVDGIQNILSRTTVAKSVGFDDKSPEWLRVQAAVRRDVQPLIDRLMKSQTAFCGERPVFLSNAVTQARRLADFAVEGLFREGVLISQKDVSRLGGLTKGQRPPTLGQSNVNEEEKDKRGPHKGVPWPSQKGRTPPGLGASPEYPRIRKSPVSSVLFERIPNTSLASAITERDNKTVLVINTDHPDFNIAIGEGENPTARFIAREIIEHAALSCSGSEQTADFLARRNELRLRLGQLIVASPEYIKAQQAKRVRK